MTLETALLSALSLVTSALCWSMKILYARLIKAEGTLEELRKLHENLKEDHGEASAKVEMFERCPKRIECPFYKSHSAI